MAGVPGFCERCNAVFENPSVSISNCTNITIQGVQVSCPRCGSTASLVDGIFNESGDGLEIVSAPISTHYVFEALYGVFEKVKLGEITQTDAISQIEKISPDFAKSVRPFIDMGIPILGFIGLLIGLYMQYQADSSNESYQRDSLRLMKQQIELLRGPQSSIQVDGVQTDSIESPKEHSGSTKTDRLEKTKK